MVEAPERARDARERWWRLAQPTLSADRNQMADDPAYRASTTAGAAMMFDEMQRLVLAKMAAADATPAVEGLEDGIDGEPVIYNTLFAMAPLTATGSGEDGRQQ